MVSYWNKIFYSQTGKRLFLGDWGSHILKFGGTRSFTTISFFKKLNVITTILPCIYKKDMTHIVKVVIIIY